MHISACASSGLSQNIDRWQKLFNVIRLMSISFRHNYILKTNCSYCDVNELLNEPPSTHCRESKKRYNNKWSILCRTWWFEKLHTHHALQKDNNPGFACSPCITVIHSHIPVLTLQWKLDTHRVLEWMCYTLKTQWDKTMQGAGGRKICIAFTEGHLGVLLCLSWPEWAVLLYAKFAQNGAPNQHADLFPLAAGVC